MTYLKIFFLISVTTWMFASCSKEYSQESGSSLPVDSTPNCKISSIIEGDYFTRLTEYAYNSTYSADHKVSSIQLVDSTNVKIDNIFIVSYSTGKIQVDTKQYFVTGTDGKVAEFHGYEFPEDTTSDRFIVRYTYNTAGQLVKRTEEYESIPGITTFQIDYTYTGKNLTKAESKAFNGNALQSFINIAYEYDATKTIKNFIYWNSIAPEIFYFQTAINAGLTSVNPVKKATTTFVGYNNGRDSSTVSNFVNYAFDTKSHVLSFEVTGDDFIVNNLHAGKKYKFDYECF